MLKRLPAFNDILQVFALTAFLVYGRLLYVFAWKLPSWLKNLHGDEILSILSYSLANALLESLALTLLLSLLAFLLPARWFRDDFIVRGAWAATIWLVSWMIYFARMKSLGLELGLTMADYVYPWILVTLALAALAAFLSTRLRFMRAPVAWLADRTLIFLFLFIPASLLGAIVMLVRNI
jgi:hypothetical protein